jgi:hypothetical protein
VEVASSPRRFPFFSPFGRSIVVLLAAAFVAFQLGRNEVTPFMLLAVAVVVALVVAIQLVPHGPLFLRRPKPEPAAAILRKDEAKYAILKRAYSAPQLTPLESREVSEPAWESRGADDSFEALRPFYIVYPERSFTAIAASLKFHGDKDYRDWQPVANSAPERSTAELLDEQYQWILIAYVPPNALFEARLMLRDSQSKLGVTVLRDLAASEDRPFQSVHLKLPAPAEHFAASASEYID